MLKKITLGFLTSLFVPAYAYGAVPASIETLIVHGEISHIAKALQRLALMMTDGRYLGLFFGVIVLTLVGGAIMMIVTSVTKGKISSTMWLSLFGTLIFGVIIYHTFIRNTTDMLITDETIGGKWQVVAGVPDGVAFIAGLLNKIESGVVEVIWTAGDIMGFRNQAGGVGFNIINKAFKDKVDLSGIDPSPVTGQYANMSIKRYIEDCFLFELGRPGSLININDINDNTNFISILGAAASPAIQTVWYDSSNPNGVSRTCQQDWNNHVQPYLAGLLAGNATVTEFWDQRCGKARFSENTYPMTMGGPAINTVCRDKVEDLVSSLMGVAVSSEQLLLQYLIATELKSVAEEGSPDDHVRAIGNLHKGNDLMGAGIILNEWLPIMKGVYYSIFLGLLPFLFLFIPTPLCFRVLSFIFGSFFFLTCWGICDAIVHSTAMDYAADCYTEIVQGRLGMKSMIMFEDESYRAMAAFGASRLMSLSMAGVLAFTVARFGGSAFAQMINRSPVAMGSHGAMAAQASSMGDPNKRASFMEGVSRSVPTQAWAGAYSTDEHASAGREQRGTATASSLEKARRLGGVPYAIEQQAGTAGMRAMDGAVTKQQIDELASESNITPTDVQFMNAEGKVHSELAKNVMTRGMQEAIEKGSLSSLTQSGIAGLTSTSAGSAWLARHGTVSRTIKPGEAVGVARMFKDRGSLLDPYKIAGTKAQMTMYADETGKLHPAMIIAGKGVDLSEKSVAKEELVNPDGHKTAMSDPSGPYGAEPVMVNQQRGNKSTTYDSVDEYQGGPRMTPGSMLNAVIGKNSVLGNRIADARTTEVRDAEKIIQAKAFAETMGGILRKTGVSATYVNANGRASLGAGNVNDEPKGKPAPREKAASKKMPTSIIGAGLSLLGVEASASTSVETGQRNAEEQNYNLYYGMARRIQENAEQEAMNLDGTLNAAKYNELYTKGLHEAWQATDALAKGKSEFSFGASSMVGSPWEHFVKAPKGGSKE